MRIMVTGGSGFVGSALIRYLLRETSADIINVDKLTDNSGHGLERVGNNTRYYFEKYDICSHKQMNPLFAKYRPNLVFNLASESDDEKSVGTPRIFLQTNIYGTFNLLECARKYLDENNNESFRFVHVSTTEVYGSEPISNIKRTLKEVSPYSPVTPHAATKAAADMLVKSWGETYGVPVVVAHASSNYGIYQSDDQLIPRTINCALDSMPIPLFGDRNEKRDWLHVDDHCRGLWLAASMGKDGQTYNFGGNEGWTNEQIVLMICNHLDLMVPRGQPHKLLIRCMGDRPGFENLYSSMDLKKAYNELIWLPSIKMMVGLKQTIEWYVERKYSKLGFKWVRDAG